MISIYIYRTHPNNPTKENQAIRVTLAFFMKVAITIIFTIYTIKSDSMQPNFTGSNLIESDISAKSIEFGAI